MLSPDQQDFYNRWLEKADNIVNGDVASLIDKYVTLFINYNFLYNIIPIKKAQETGNAREQVGDRGGATTFTIDFLGAAAIAHYLTQQGLDNQIQALCQAMPHFNIDLIEEPRSLTATNNLLMDYNQQHLPQRSLP